MYKRVFVGLGIAGILAFSGAILTQPVSALTIDEIQVQIQSLLAQISALQQQLKSMGGGTQPVDPVIGVTVAPSKHRICQILYRNLAQGTQGDDVQGLQEFLHAEGYLSANPTGYFGPMTGQAVAKWQSSQGVSAVGHFGPMSRERMKVWCGGGGNERFSASPQRGTAPLSVTFYSKISGFRPASDTYAIDFGDGTSERAANCYAPTDYCQSPGQNTHTYTSNGTYTATLTHSSDPCGGNPLCMAPVSLEIVGKVQINVGSACTMEYNPICGAKPIVCITTPCNPIQQTYSNRCAMNADGASFLYEGQCRADWKNPADDPQCRRWTDGKYCGATCRRDTQGGTPICSIPACMYPGPTTPPSGAPQCLEYFGTSDNRPPVISGFSGPTTLAVNSTGTWTINASDPENGELRYFIVWGDERASTKAYGVAANIPDEFVQATTFTHAYSSAGTYTVSITARDSAGQAAKSSSTVRVGGGTCSNNGTSYSDGDKLSCLHNDDGTKTCIIDASYVCRSGQWKKEGSYPTACTADAYQCPNGTYVGRTGSNCQFVCSANANIKCSAGYGWCGAGSSGSSCALLTSSGACPIIP